MPADQDEALATRLTHERLQRVLALALPQPEHDFERAAVTFLRGLREALALEHAALRVHADVQSGLPGQVVQLGGDEAAAGLTVERSSLGAADELGSLECASSRPGFPSSGERMVLQVAAGRLALALHEARSRAYGLQRARGQEQEQVSRAARYRELFSYVAHEVNQPLAAVVSNANACTRWLAHTPANVEEAVAAAARIAGDARRASEVVARVRGLFRAPELQHQEVSARAALASVAEALLAEQSASQVQLSLRAAPDLTVFADRSQLEQVLLQLARNAIEAMASARLGERRLTLAADSQDERRVRFSVSDSGPGLLPMLRERMFDPFLTSKPGGLALGLRITRSLVQAHEGRLWSEPNAEGGESFHFTMPRHRA